MVREVKKEEITKIHYSQLKQELENRIITDPVDSAAFLIDNYERLEESSDKRRVIKEVQKTLKQIDDKADQDFLIQRLRSKSNVNLGKSDVLKKVGIFDVRNYTPNVEKFYDRQPFFYDKNNLFWLWNPTLQMWENVDELELQCMIEDTLQLSGETVSNMHKSAYLEAFKRVGRRNIPVDIGGVWVQYGGQLYNIENGEEKESSPGLFLTNNIPWELGDSEDTPTMDKIFKDWVGSKYVQTLYEMVAFATVPKYFIHRMFVLTGSGRNGKSTFFDLITRFIGMRNICSAELDEIMNNKFATAKLFKKTLCLMGETNFTVMKNTSKIKKLSGGDLITVEYKNKNPFDTYNYAKIFIATNGLPETEDKSDGFFRRFMTLDFPNKFSEKEDILSTIPDIEYNNLARKCLRIARELFKRRTFTNEGTVEERKERYLAKSNPMDVFLKEKTKKDSSSYVFCYEFRELFQSWCKDNGHREWSNMKINKEMRAKGFEIQKKPKNFGDISKWYLAYLDITLT